TASRGPRRRKTTVSPGRRTTTRRAEPLISRNGPGTNRGAAATVVSAYGKRRHGLSSWTTSDEAEGAVTRAPANSHRAGAPRSRTSRLSAAAIDQAARHVNVQRLKSADAFHAEQRPGTTAPVIGSVRSGVK